MMLDVDNEPIRHVHDTAAKRTAILAAAHVRFSHENYDRVSLEEIAADSNVDTALITEYFDSKESLLEEVLAEALYPSVLMDGDRATFGQRLMAAFSNDASNRLELDYFLLLLRITMVPSLQPMLQKLVRERLTLPFTAWMGGPDAALRARLVHTILTGTSMDTLLEGDASLVAADAERYRSFFAGVIQNLVDGNIPEDIRI